MSTVEKANAFAKLHVKGAPLLLYNAWDVGSAKAIASAGAPAIATSSWAVAAAQGFADGEDLPLERVFETAERIVANVEVPVSVDFEGSYAAGEASLETNIARLIGLGVVGVNFEDRVVQGQGLYALARQASRIAALRRAAEAAKTPLFINARTDLFLGRGAPDPKDSLAEALERAKAYADAGASGLFIPGLADEALIGAIVEAVSLPVNVMLTSATPSPQRLAELGVARISWGTGAYEVAIDSITRDAARAFAG